MRAPNRDIRNEIAKRMLDHGFANYTVYTHEKENGKKVNILKGTDSKIKTTIGEFSALISKGDAEKVEVKTTYKKELTAPVKKGDKVGEAAFFVNGKEIGRADIVVAKGVDKLGYGDILVRLIKSWFLR